MRTRLLSQPLWIKLLGANALLVLIALAAALAVGLEREHVLLIGLALAVGMVANILLVTLALSPIRALQVTADRLASGDAAARVPPTPFTDPALHNVSETVNGLLQRLEADRARLRDLVWQVMQAEDRERHRIGVVLHESIAQSLAAVLLELAVAEAGDASEPVRARVQAVRAQVRQMLSDVGTLARTMHSSALRDLGLVAGLRELARTSGEGSMAVRLDVDERSEQHMAHLDPAAGAALHRVAQEAVQNALRHSGAALVQMELSVADGRAHLRLEDDGVGFDVPAVEARRTGGGLFTMRERLALMGGDFAVDSTPGTGTVVRASVRLHPPSRQITSSGAR
jgi:signal transduction histidine kinase